MRKIITKNISLSLFVVLSFAILFQNCREVEIEQQEMHSIEVGGQTFMYPYEDKAFGDIYLGMLKSVVDSIVSNNPPIQINDIGYTPYMEYSNDGILKSLYLKSDTIYYHSQTYLILQGLEEVIESKYGSVNTTYLSELNDINVSKFTKVEGSEVHWGSHWEENNKYIGLGISKEEEYKSVWIWFFNDIWIGESSNTSVNDVSKF